jgi:hypothetical protein
MSASPKITVRYAEENYGPYTLDQINGLLSSGRLAPDDLAWVEGSPEWTRLAQVPGVHAIPPLRALKGRTARAGESDRLILPAFLLAFFLGVLGLHRFYVGKTGSGVVMLVLTITVIGALVSWIWATIDWVMLVCGAFTDADGRRLTQWT